jgi:hypothetical protein
MRQTLSTALGLILGLALCVCVALEVHAKEKDSARQDRVGGSVHAVNRETSTITLQRGRAQRQVVYSSDTKFTYRNQPASLDEVKPGRRVICVGRFNPQKQLIATQVDVRDGR